MHCKSTNHHDGPDNMAYCLYSMTATTTTSPLSLAFETCMPMVDGVVGVASENYSKQRAVTITIQISILQNIIGRDRAQ